jgi:hypothetical protein
MLLSVGPTVSNPFAIPCVGLNKTLPQTLAYVSGMYTIHFLRRKSFSSTVIIVIVIIISKALFVSWDPLHVSLQIISVGTYTLRQVKLKLSSQGG